MSKVTMFKKVRLELLLENNNNNNNFINVSVTRDSRGIDPLLMGDT